MYLPTMVFLCLMTVTKTIFNKENKMLNQDRFWDLLAKKINQLRNLSDSIEIKILTLNAEGVVVNNYDFNADEISATVNVGEDMKLTLFRKSQFKYLIRFEGEMEDGDILDSVLDEFEMVFSFTRKVEGYEVFDLVDC